MNILTLTLNPAFDIHCHTETFVLHSENFARITSRNIGGKGINISRALTANGVPNTAIVVAGTENGEEFLKSARAEGINCKAIEVFGRIRENITIHTNDARETRLSFSGVSIDGSVIDKISEMLKQEDLKNSIVTFTGSVPEGADIKKIMALLSYIKMCGAHLVIDSRSLTIDDLKGLAPFLIKPNEEEIRKYSDIKISDIASAGRAAKELCEQGIENVMISLGSRGAVLATACGVYFAAAPRVEVKSTIGAGDSTIAGFISSVAKGESARDALATAVSFGTAACMTEGTNAPQKTDIEKIKTQVTVKNL